MLPREFKIPESYETDKYRLRMLTINDVIKDYDTVMTSINRLQGIFGPESPWPSQELTLEQDLIDLGWHQKEFQKRSSFAYTVVSLDEQEIIGCMYIFPSKNKDYEVDIFMWVRQSRSELDSDLYQTVRQWLQEKWPFKKIRYAGREHSF